MAATRNRFNEFWSDGIVVERLPKQPDRVCEVANFDKGIRPYTLHQIVLIDYAAAVLNEDEK